MEESLPQRTKFFFSGISNTELPEIILADKNPSVLLTYWEIYNFKRDTIRRLKRHFKARRTKKGLDTDEEI